MAGSSFGCVRVCRMFQRAVVVFGDLGVKVPEIRDNLLRRYDGKWKKIAKQQMKSFFNPSDAEIREQARRWADTYNFDVLESLIADPPKCTICGQEATKRCSRCQNEWYCRRECQVEHWPKHKKACDLLQEAMGKLEQQTQREQTKS